MNVAAARNILEHLGVGELMTEEDVDREMNLEGLIKNRPPIM